LKVIQINIFIILIFTISVIHSQDECDGERYQSDIFSNINVTYNIEYGENITEDIIGNEYSQTLYLDVYEPADDNINERPLIIFMFGGSFITGSRSSSIMQELCTRYAKMGYVASAIDYTISPTLIWNGTEANAYKAVMKAIHDLKAAIRFFRMNEQGNDNFGIDTSRVYAGGSSAGAISAVNAAYINSESEIPGPIYDFVIDNGGLEGLSGNPGFNSSFYGVVNLCGAIGHYDWIEPDDIPIVSVHGDEDTVVPYADDLVTLFGINLQVYGSLIIHETMIELGNQSALHTFEGAGHTPYANLGSNMDITVEFTRDFMYDIVCNQSQSGEIVISYNEDWNLVGLPLTVENAHIEVIFPESIENTLFSFGEGYVLQNTMENGLGYWLRFDGEGYSPISGLLINELTVELSEGWNLISGISETISVDSILDLDGIIIDDTIFGFSDGYYISDTINPGSGYWVRASSSGAIDLVLLR